MGRFQSESVAEQIYRAFTRKNSVYVSIIMIGAVIGEKVRKCPSITYQELIKKVEYNEVNGGRACRWWSIL